MSTDKDSASITPPDHMENTLPPWVTRAHFVDYALNWPGEGFCVLSVEGCFEFCNKAALELLGCESTGQLLGRPASEYLYVREQSEAPFASNTAGLGKVLRGASQRYFEEQWARRLDGSVFPIECWFEPLRDGGRLLGTVCTFVDVSSRKNNEAYLKLTRFSVDNALEAIYTLDETGTIIDINETVLTRLRCDRDDVIGSHFFDLHDDELLDSWPRTWERLQSQRQLMFETEHRRKDGSAYAVEVAMAYFAFDQAHYCCAFARDVSERENVSAALHESRRALSTLLGNLPGVAYRRQHDEQWTLEFASQGCLEVTGYKPDALIYNSSVSYFELIHPDDRRQAREQLNLAVAQHVPYHMTYRILTSTNEERWVRDQGLGVHADGELIALEGFISDTTEAHRLSEKLSYEATHDPLTGLQNRRAFDERLKNTLERVEDGEVEHALCYVDLDQFKVINDVCGHVAGDELLRQLAQILRAQIRKHDALARLGGDEFAVLMEYCSLPNAERVADKIRQAVEDFSFNWQDKRFGVGASIGLVPITETNISATEVLSAADSACYVAKDTGRNRVHVYLPDDAHVARRHGEMQWVTRITDALENDLFQLYCQPIIALDESHNEYVHYEVLLRLVQPDGEVIPPGAFLPAAERYNLSAKIDRWVVAKTLQHLESDKEQLERLNVCAINLSAPSLTNASFVDFVEQALDATRVPSAKICFEITETAAIANLSMATEFIKRLKRRGVLFALDDFGSGLSSFAYLKTLPVDILKIDGLFVKDILEDDMDFAMVKSINEIGHVMGKQTIAEFVETDAIRAKLTEIGVDYSQGYGLGMPRPFSEVFECSDITTAQFEIPVLAE